MAKFRVPLFVSLLYQDLMRFEDVPAELPFQLDLPVCSSDNKCAVGVRGPFKVHYRGGVRIEGEVELDMREAGETHVTILRAFIFTSALHTPNRVDSTLRAVQLLVEARGGNPEVCYVHELHRK